MHTSFSKIADSVLKFNTGWRDAAHTVWKDLGSKRYEPWRVEGLAEDMTYSVVHLNRLYVFYFCVHSYCLCTLSWCFHQNGFRCVLFVQWGELALPVFEGWNGAWGAEGKPPVDPGVLPNASKFAKSAFALAFCAAGGGVRMRFRQMNKKDTMRG